MVYYKGRRTFLPGADGRFCLERFGAFVSVRHAGFAPLLRPTADVRKQSRIAMARSDAKTVRNLVACRELPGRYACGRIGHFLRVKPPNGAYEGPEYGEHDTDWYIKSGNATLHMVDGHAWHSGLPLETLLKSYKSIDTRGWEYGTQVGLDLSGVSENGRRWRWFGAPTAEAISYEEATEAEAENLNKVIDSVCYAGSGAR